MIGLSLRTVIDAALVREGRDWNSARGNEASASFPFTSFFFVSSVEGTLLLSFATKDAVLIIFILKMQWSSFYALRIYWFMKFSSQGYSTFHFPSSYDAILFIPFFTLRIQFPLHLLVLYSGGTTFPTFTEDHKLFIFHWKVVFFSLFLYVFSCLFFARRMQCHFFSCCRFSFRVAFRNEPDAFMTFSKRWS